MRTADQEAELIAKQHDEWVLESLKFIQNKGNCFETLPRAFCKLKEIRSHIETKDYYDINVALCHKELGEGSDELNVIMKEVIKKWE